MARKSKAKAKPKKVSKPKSAKPDAAVAIKLPSKNAVKDTMAKALNIQNDIRNRSQAMGTLLNDAEANLGIHKGAFGQAKKLMKMDTLKLKAWLGHFDHYLDALGLRAKADAQKDLPGISHGADAQAAVPKSADNVTAFAAKGDEHLKRTVAEMATTAGATPSNGAKPN